MLNKILENIPDIYDIELDNNERRIRTNYNLRTRKNRTGTFNPTRKEINDAISFFLKSGCTIQYINKSVETIYGC